MNTRRYRTGPGSRLETGAAILAAAHVVDTAPIKGRLSTFSAAHRSYAGAQDKVGAAARDVRAARAKVGRRGAELEAAVEALALALATEGHSRTKPFAAFGALTPSSVKLLAVDDKIRAVEQLVDRVEQAKAVSQKTRDVAQAAARAARNLAAALVPIAQLEASLRELRWRRDTLGNKWDTALAALRRDTLSAADEGAPGLYPALFGRSAHPIRKRAQPAPAPTPVPTPEPAPPIAPVTPG
jgi:hypothetical protein